MAAYVQSFLASPGWAPRGMAAVAAEAFGLGSLFGLSVVLSVFVPSLRPFFVFCTLLAAFHMTEFLFAAVYHSYTCSTESFLIPHSTAYSVAMGASVLEYWIEWAFFGSFLNSVSLFWIGLCVSVAGQVRSKRA